MRKTNKKGFTIVELVIVIAVIAILASILIPTFSGVIGDAAISAATADAKSAYSEHVTNQVKANAEVAQNGLVCVEVNGTTYYFEVVDGQVNLDSAWKWETKDGKQVRGEVKKESEVMAADECWTDVNGVLVNKGAHTYDDCKDVKCDVCGEGAREALEHIYDDCADADCNVCDAERTAGTCVDVDTDTDTLCDVCGKELAPADPEGT